MPRLILRMVLPYVGTFIVAFLLAGLVLGKKGKKVKHQSPEEEPKPKAKIGVMDLILIIELIAIFAYCIVDFWVFWYVGSEPASLTIGFFAVCGGENGFMAWIKTRKEQERFRRWQLEDAGTPEKYKEDTKL